MTHKGLVWRYIPKGSHALDYRYLLLANGRWNRFGVYGCLYTALTRKGAEAEYRKILQTLKIRPDQDAPKELVSIYVSVHPVLNLCSVSVTNDIGADPSCLVGDSDEDIEYCNSLADWARASGYSAILSPSATASGQRNLTIYLTDKPSLLSIKVGPDREPLNY